MLLQSSCPACLCLTAHSAGFETDLVLQNCCHFVKQYYGTFLDHQVSRDDSTLAWPLPRAKPSLNDLVYVQNGYRHHGQEEAEPADTADDVKHSTIPGQELPLLNDDMLLNPMNTRTRRVFESVFPQSTPSHPTPVATPETGFTAPGQAFGSPAIGLTSDRAQIALSSIAGIGKKGQENVSDQVVWDRSWHVVTSYLVTLVHCDEFMLNNYGLLPSPPALPEPTQDTCDALQALIEAEGTLLNASYQESISGWYSDYVRHHYLEEVLPILQQIFTQSQNTTVLQTALQVLTRAHRLYRSGISLIARQMHDSQKVNTAFVQKHSLLKLQALINASLADVAANHIRTFIFSKIAVILGIPGTPEEHRDDEPFRIDERRIDAENTKGVFLACVGSMHLVGLGGENFQIIFAEAMNEALQEYVYRTFGRAWGASSVPRLETSVSANFKTDCSHGGRPDHPMSQRLNQLCAWVEDDFARLAVEVLKKVDGAKVSWQDVAKWKNMGTSNLANVRIDELFEIVVGWPTCEAALDDLKATVSTPKQRLHLTDTFSSMLDKWLLRADASTLDILRTYISIIRSFHFLDQSKVLLDRVAYSLQIYLFSRSDTVEIIITGLLSDVAGPDVTNFTGRRDTLGELAALLNEASNSHVQSHDDGIDWDDLEWQPDPVDAGPGYRRSKSADVIGTLLGVLGSPEVFIREFQKIVGENLLQQEGNFEKELRLLELFKTRFGDAALQACEVMVKDIFDSRRLNTSIREKQSLEPSADELAMAQHAPRSLNGEYVSIDGLLQPSIHARILSRFFWPNLPEGGYRVPREIALLLDRYGEGYESLQDARKLSWLHEYGRATVELDLEDRIVREQVHTWQATVIWAFQAEAQERVPTCRSVSELMDHLEMEEPLVRSALEFWAAKLVLAEIRTDCYQVLETLDRASRERSIAKSTMTKAADSGYILEPHPNNADRGHQSDIHGDKGEVYWQFIKGMLKNSSAQMPLQQIGMMLKMLIADGFPFSNEDLKEFLMTKVNAGELDVKGGKFKLKK